MHTSKRRTEPKYHAAVVVSLVALGLTPLTGNAADTGTEPDGYAVSRSGQVVRSQFGECVHTSEWTAGDSIAGCDGYTEPVARSTAQPQVASTAPEATLAAVEPVVKTYTLETEALFDFDKAVLRPQARESLNELADRIQARSDVANISVTGYTDRLGPAAYNLTLSRERAAAVSDYLHRRTGIASDKFVVRGRGESKPLSACDTVRGEAALIDCLQPNRRVEIDIDVKTTEPPADIPDAS